MHLRPRHLPTLAMTSRCSRRGCWGSRQCPRPLLWATDESQGVWTVGALLARVRVGAGGDELSLDPPFLLELSSRWSRERFGWSLLAGGAAEAACVDVPEGWVVFASGSRAIAGRPMSAVLRGSTSWARPRLGGW